MISPTDAKVRILDGLNVVDVSHVTNPKGVLEQQKTNSELYGQLRTMFIEMHKVPTIRKLEILKDTVIMANSIPATEFSYLLKFGRDGFCPFTLGSSLLAPGYYCLGFQSDTICNVLLHVSPSMHYSFAYKGSRK